MLCDKLSNEFEECQTKFGEWFQSCINVEWMYPNMFCSVLQYAYVKCVEKDEECEKRRREWLRSCYARMGL